MEEYAAYSNALVDKFCLHTSTDQCTSKTYKDLLAHAAQNKPTKLFLMDHFQAGNLVYTWASRALQHRVLHLVLLLIMIM